MGMYSSDSTSLNSVKISVLEFYVICLNNPNKFLLKNKNKRKNLFELPQVNLCSYN